MTDIIEKSVTAKDLPLQLRGDIEPDAHVLVSVRRLTANHFTEEFEHHVLAAEKSGAGPAESAKDIIGELRKIADEDQPH